MRDRKKCTFVTGLKRLVIAGVVAAMVTVSMGNVWGGWRRNCKRSDSIVFKDKDR